MSRITWFTAAALTFSLGAAMPAEAQEPSNPAQAQQQSFTDAQISAFATASAEIDPISRGLASATAEERAQSTQQIRDILARNNLDADTYNAIATAARADQALAARIEAARPAGAENQPQGGEPQ
jgi:hypothetical protein